jgi:hypothetical protein
LATVRARLPADVQDDVPRLLGRAGEVDVAAGRLHPLLVSLQIEVEVREGVFFDVPRGVAQPLELGQSVGGRLALFHETAPHFGERDLQLLVSERLASVFLELRRGGVNGHGGT